METLYLFSNMRAIKEFFAQNYANSFLPEAKSIGEFLDFVLRVENKRKIPSFLRSFYLFEAVRATNTQKLGDFAQNFTQFLLNSSFFLKFYDELCAECVSIENLQKCDIYAFYDDHLEVLKQVFQAYQANLASNDFFDKYFLEDYHITFELLSNFKEIQIYVEGFLSRFELCVFKEISKKIPIIFILQCDTFNREYYEKSFGIALGIGDFIVKLESEKFICTDMQNITLNTQDKMQILCFQDRIAEVGALFSEIDIWLQRGILPEQICVVLPSEEFIPYLKLFDVARNCNFAMGQYLSESVVYRDILESKVEFSSFLEFEDFLQNLGEESREKIAIKEKFLEGLEEFKFALQYLEHLNVREQILVFLQFLQDVSIEDTDGGRIRVVGILESRGASFDYILIPEFNAENVPSLNQKDLFLNTKIREFVGLPTSKDRENLQKHYYMQMFKKAKEVKIFCLDNAENKPSRFLLEDSIFGAKKRLQGGVEYSAYFLEGVALNYKEVEIIAPLEIETMCFSATSLQCFLICKRKFYYQYILGLKTTQSKSATLGEKIHNALKEVYSTANKSFCTKDLYDAVCSKLQAQNTRELFENTLAKKYLQRFFAYEKQHLEQGWNPTFFEKRFPFVEGATFRIEGVAFKGSIDRIDRKANAIYVLDYKYKKNLSIDSHYEKSVDFQLPIYYLAMQEFFKDCTIETGFYSIYDAKIIQEKDLQSKVFALRKTLQEIKQGAKEVNFSLTPKLDACRFCDFIYLCNRYKNLGF